MSSEEIEQKEEEKLEKEEIPVPLYFDRYVTGELRALGQQIINLTRSMDERFANLKESMDERFAQVDRRFEDVDKRFDKLEKWVIGLFFPLITGILAIIIKMFIFGK